MSARRGWIDGLAVACVAVCSFVVGSRYDEAFIRSQNPFFGQAQFAPAVMLTCGRGFINPAEAPPALDDFLNLKRDSLSCGDLPQEIPQGRLTTTQRLYRYLMETVAWQ